MLVELGTEELPPKALPTLEQAFADGVAAGLDKAELDARRSSSRLPRRAGSRCWCAAWPASQPDQHIKRRGPPVSAALRCRRCADAAPRSRFAHSCGVPSRRSARERDAKGDEYLCFEGRKRGAATPQLLPGIVQAALDALPIPKRMRWGAGEAQFVRPVHWLVMLFGAEVVPATMLGDQRRRHHLRSPLHGARPLRISSPGALRSAPCSSAAR